VIQEVEGQMQRCHCCGELKADVAWHTKHDRLECARCYVLYLEKEEQPESFGEILDRSRMLREEAEALLLSEIRTEGESL